MWTFDLAIELSSTTERSRLGKTGFLGRMKGGGLIQCRRLGNLPRVKRFRLFSRIFIDAPIEATSRSSVEAAVDELQLAARHCGLTHAHLA